MRMASYSTRVWGCVKKALPVAIKTSVWFLKIMLPVSLFVTLLSYFNILPYISSFASPLFTLIGLPGDAALVFVTIYEYIYGDSLAFHARFFRAGKFDHGDDVFDFP